MNNDQSKTNEKGGGGMGKESKRMIKKFQLSGF